MKLHRSSHLIVWAPLFFLGGALPVSVWLWHIRSQEFRTLLEDPRYGFGMLVVAPLHLLAVGNSILFFICYISISAACYGRKRLGLYLIVVVLFLGYACWWN